MSSDQSTEKPEIKDTGCRPGDDAWTKWRNTFALLSGGLTAEGKQQYRRARDDHNEDSDCQRCEKHRDYLLSYSTMPVGLACAGLIAERDQQARSFAFCVRRSITWAVT